MPAAWKQNLPLFSLKWQILVKVNTQITPACNEGKAAIARRLGYQGSPMFLAFAWLRTQCAHAIAVSAPSKTVQSEIWLLSNTCSKCHIPAVIVHIDTIFIQIILYAFMHQGRGWILFKPSTKDCKLGIGWWASLRRRGDVVSGKSPRER